MEGKANEIFLDWITSKYFFKDKRYSDLNIYQKGDIGEFLRFPITKNAYILEWMDSLGPEFGGWTISDLIYSELNHMNILLAIDKAIKKAIELYNSQC
ncbi:hypothetical protein CMU19_04430 [Elizabethkingia anophelis]|nr:hypothetical protein [Elizabethkingia anophelis]